MGAEASTPGARGVDVSLATTGGKRWWTGVGLGGKLYGLPCNAEHLLIFDPSCFTDPVTFIDTRSVAKGEGKWRSTVALGGKLYGIPDRAEAMLIYDFVSKQVIGIDTRKVAKGPLKWQSAVSLAGKVYGIPLNAEKLLVFDPKVHDSSASRPKSSPSKSDGLSGVETGHVATGKLKWLAGLSLGGKVIGVPCNSDALLVYDPLSHSSVGVPTNYHASGPFKWLCAVAFQGMLYAIPCHADCILIFDPSNNRLSHVDTRAVATGPGKWLSCVVVAQKIYGIPDRASNVLVFDPTTEEVSGIDVSGVCDGTAKWQSAAVLGGKIYAVPYHAHDILVVDPASSTASTIDIRSLGTGNGKWGFGAVLGGSLCGLPWDSPKILVYQPSETKEDLSPLAAKPSAEKDVDVDVEAASDPVEHGYKGTPDISSKLGKVLLQDFVGAWLSEWIYFADPAKPYAVPTMKVDGSPVKFQVHSVMDDPLLGSPARSAVVTAMLPGAQVVYLVFKGSSFMNDFVANASVSPDYTPFDATFQDRTTFIHHGAYHATAQLRVQQWPALQEQLERCVQDGVKQMVITGHSLGGQYALAFMLQVFLDGVKGTSLHPLLQEARCAAFGAPMCYGAAEGSDIRQDLATFIHARTVSPIQYCWEQWTGASCWQAVYINAGDPAPRLWSELDLEDFMRYAIRWFQGKVSSFSMRILDYAAGGLAQKAQEILKRPDIEKHLLRPAARYVHLSQIRVLAKDFLLWRPLSYGRMNIDEHSLAAGYIPALCASFDPIAAGGLWDENGTSLVDEEGHGIV